MYRVPWKSLPDNVAFCKPACRPDWQSGNPDSGKVRPGLRVVGLGTRNPAARDPEGRPSSVARVAQPSSSQAPIRAYAEPPKRARLRPAGPNKVEVAGVGHRRQTSISWRVGTRNEKSLVDQALRRPFRAVLRAEDLQPNPAQS